MDKYFKMIKVDDDTMECDVHCDSDDILDFAFYFMFLMLEYSEDKDKAELELKELIHLARKECDEREL